MRKFRDFTSRKIFERLLKRYPFPVKLIVGANGDRYPGWLSSEKSYLDITKAADWEKYFDVSVPVTTAEQIGTRIEEVDGVEQEVKYQLDVPEEQIEYKSMQVIKNILADHVIQELDWNEAVQAMKLAHKYLKPGGRIRISVPDEYHRDKKFVKMMKQIYPPKWEYDKNNMLRMLRAAGFKHFQVKEAFDIGGLFNISTWYRIDGFCKRSFWYDPNNMTMSTGMFWSCLIIDAIKDERNNNYG